MDLIAVLIQGRAVQGDYIIADSFIDLLDGLIGHEVKVDVC